jgi:aminoglycoside 6'-N-acetyltransferase I
MRATQKDAQALAGLVKIVWPEHTEADLTRIILEYMDSDGSAVFAEKRDGSFIGVALCSLRHDYVEGCETSPVGYLEGVSVKETCRNQGVARRLVEECENWAREKGYRKFASDCELSNTASLSFHLQLGFREQNRIICFKKDL